MIEKRNIFDTAAFWIVTGLTFLVPIFFLPPSVLGISLSKVALITFGVLIALICFAIERIREGSLTLPTRPWYLLLILIPALYFVSSLFGVHWYKSLIGGMYEQDTFHMIALSFVLVFLIMSLATTTKRVWTIMLSAAASILVVSLFQIALLVAGPSLAFGALSIPALSLAGSWNDLTALAVLFLGLLVITLETMKLSKKATYTLSALLVLPFFFVILSHGNFNFDLWLVRFNLPIFIAFIALLLFAYTFTVSKVKSKDAAGRSSVSKASLIVLVLSVLVVIFGGMIRNPLATSTGVSYISGQPNWQPTLNVAKEVLAQKPVTGSGPNTFTYEWNLHKPAEFNRLVFWNTNFAFGVGIIPTSLVTVGIVGFLLWLLFYGFVIAKSGALLFKGDKSGPYAVRASVAFSALFTTFLMFFSTPGIVIQTLHFVFIGLLFALDFAVTKSRLTLAFHSKQWQHFVSIVVAVIVIAASLFWGYMATQKVMASYYANRAVVVSTTEEEALGYLGKALSFDSSQPVFGQLVSQVYVSRISKLAAQSATEIEANKEVLQAAIDASVAASVTAERMDPTDFTAPVMTGRLLEYLGGLGVSGAYDQAIAKYEASSALSPTNPLPFIFASNAALLNGDKAAAEQYMIKAITLKDNYSDSPALAEGIAEIINTINGGQAGNPELVIEDEEDEAATTTDENISDEE